MVHPPDLFGGLGDDDVVLLSLPVSPKDLASQDDPASRRAGVPVVCHVAEARFRDQLENLTLFPIEIRMKKPWE